MKNILISYKVLYKEVNEVRDGGINVIDTNEKIDYYKLENLYLKYREIMYKEANKVLRNTYDAEDAVQIAFERLANCTDKITDEIPAMTCSFMKIVAKNTAVNVGKQRLYLNKYENTFDILQDELIDQNLELADLVIDKVSVERIIEKIKSLPDKYRDIIVLEKIYGYSREETMALYGENYETIKRRLTRAKTKLLEVLKQEELNGNRNTIKSKDHKITHTKS